jgi:hypothetical protein
VGADPVQLPEHQLRPEGTGSRAAFERQPAGHRRPRPRCARAGDLWLPCVGAVCPDVDRAQLDHRRDRRGLAGLLWRLGRPGRAALPGNLVRLAGAVPADHPCQLRAAQLLVAAGDHAAVFLDEPGGCGARRVPARAQPRICARGQSPGDAERRDHVPPYPAQCHGLDHDVHAVHPHRRHRHPDCPGFPRLWPAGRFAFAGRAGGPGQIQPASAVAGHERVCRAGNHVEFAGVYRRVRSR